MEAVATEMEEMCDRELCACNISQMSGGGRGEKTFSLLPQEVFQMILQYLPLSDVSKMDMAIVNHSLRPQFLDTLNGMLIPSFEDNEFEWMMLRNIIPQTFHQHHCDDHHCLAQSHIDIVPFLLKVRNHLEFLTLDGISKSDFRKLGAFPELKIFGLSLLGSPISLKSLVRFFGLNPQIEQITLNYSLFNYNSTLITSLAPKWPNLKYLNLSNNLWFNDYCVAKLAQSNLNLLSLDIGSTDVQQDGSLLLILNAFPNLQHLSFEECEDISREMREFCLRNVAIRSLRSHDLEVQVVGFEDLRSYFDVLGSGETGIEFPISDETLSVLMSTLLPLLQSPILVRFLEDRISLFIGPQTVCLLYFADSLDSHHRQ
jgi:hypothetical protein